MDGFYKVEFYVPTDHAEVVKDSMFAAGAGKLGHYDRCCWQTVGTGQFRPLEGSTPFLGKAGHTETVEELKVEMICDAESIAAVIKALRSTHPYETPAYSFWPVNP